MRSLLAFLLFVRFSFCVWTTCTPIPLYGSVGAAAVIGESLYVLSGSDAFKYSALSDQWTSFVPRPSARYAQAVGATSTTVIAVAGAPSTATTSPSANVEVYTVATDTWAAATPIPTGRLDAGMASAAPYHYVLGGLSPLSMMSFERYNSLTDAWNSLQSCPGQRESPGVDITDGHVIAAGHTTAPANIFLFIYAVDTDAWSTKMSVPSPLAYIHDTLIAAGGYAFVTGNNNSPPGVQLHKYNLVTDSWTTMIAAPLNFAQGASGITDSGLFILAGRRTGGTQKKDVCLYRTGISTAGVTGDPLFTTFTHHSHHLALRTGVFNVLTTATVVVNAMVEQLQHLTPEEDTYITMIGIVATLNECFVMVYCTASPDTLEAFCAHRSFFCSSEVLSSTLHPTEHGFTVVFPELAITMETHSLFVYDTDVTTSAFINLYVSPTASTNTNSFGGLLGDLSSKPLPFVEASLADGQYEHGDGCLYALDAAATLGVFSAAHNTTLREILDC